MRLEPLREKAVEIGYLNTAKSRRITAISRSAIFVFPSLREGLSVSLMEAMASGLPCAVSRIRGNVDLIDENGGVFFDPRDVVSCKKSLKNIIKQDYHLMGLYNTEKVREFSLNRASEIIRNVYNC